MASGAHSIDALAMRQPLATYLFKSKTSAPMMAKIYHQTPENFTLELNLGFKRNLL